MSHERPLLEVDGVRKAFGRVTVLEGAGFSASCGRITTLMGRNGAGKTTLLRIAIGRVRPDQGRVLYRGRFIARPSLARLASDGLMYVGQGSALTPMWSIEDHFGAYVRTFGGGERIAGIVEELALGEMLARRPGGVSGGERQRASLGLALLRAPECLLMDEPFAGVAPRDRPLVSGALRRLRDRGTALVVSGHDVEDLMAVSDDIIWVTAGTTHWLGGPGQASRHTQFRRDYLGPRRAFGGPATPSS